LNAVHIAHYGKRSSAHFRHGDRRRGLVMLTLMADVSTVLRQRR